MYRPSGDTAGLASHAGVASHGLSSPVSTSRNHRAMFSGAPRWNASSSACGVHAYGCSLDACSVSRVRNYQPVPCSVFLR